MIASVLTYLRPSITQGGVWIPACFLVRMYEHLSYPAPPVLQSCFLSAGSGWCLGLSWEVAGLINYQEKQEMQYLNQHCAAFPHILEILSPVK